MGWNDTQERRLRALKRAGFTVSQIARKMDKGRGAIAGKLFRLGLLGRAKKGKRAAALERERRLQNRLRMREIRASQ